MNYTDKHIVKSYSVLLDGLSPISKKALIESLSNSLNARKETNEDDFYKSFGAFGSDKPAEEIIEEIKSGRKFSNKEIKL